MGLSQKSSPRRCRRNSSSSKRLKLPPQTLARSDDERRLKSPRRARRSPRRARRRPPRRHEKRERPRKPRRRPPRRPRNPPKGEEERSKGSKGSTRPKGGQEGWQEGQEDLPTTIAKGTKGRQEGTKVKTFLRFE